LNKAINDIIDALSKNWYTYKTRSNTTFYVKVIEPKLTRWGDDLSGWVNFRALRYNHETKNWLLLSFTSMHSFGKWERVPDGSKMIEELNKSFNVKKVKDLLNGD